MRPIPKPSRPLMNTIVQFLKAGGSRKNPIVRKFCLEFGASESDLDFLVGTPSVANEIEQSLRDAGLLAL